MGQTRTFYPYIDYRLHPAFRDIAADPDYDDAEVNGLVGRIDDALVQLHAAKYPDDELPNAFNADPGVRIGALETYLRRAARSQRMTEWFDRALSDVRTELLEEARVANWRSLNGNISEGERGLTVANALREDGVHIDRLEPETRAELREICAPQMARLREKAKEGGVERLVYTYERYSKVGMILERFFERSGIMSGLKGFVGSNVSFAGFSLEYSHDKQKWWRGLYSDIGLPESKTNYMHYDHGARDPKAIIALSEVTEETGPTGFVKGSHRKERSGFLHTMVKSLDHTFRPDPSLPYEQVYYRNRFSKIEYRREFLQQPTAFQACSHFGDDIMDDTPLSRELLSTEVKMTHDRGNCIVFDGNYGIHRGALVRKGERFVFQVVFEIAPPLPFMTRIKREARGVALRLLGKGN